MRLGMLVSRLGAAQLSAAVINVEVSLAGAIDSIGPMQAGVEPLGGIRCSHLGRQHDAHFVEEGAGSAFGVEVATLPAPVGPGSREAIEALLRARFTAEAFFLRQLRQSFLVWPRPPQEGGHALFLNAGHMARHATLAKIFLRQDVACDLAPISRNLHVLS